MKHETPPVEEETLSCEVCLESVPAVDDEYGETDEYVAYYYGLECYELWQQKKHNSVKVIS